MSAKRVPRTTPLRTLLTAAAIIGAGVLTGTLLALTPIFDETLNLSIPHEARPLFPVQSSGTFTGLHPFTSIPHHGPQPHFLHGARSIAATHIDPTANL